MSDNLFGSLAHELGVLLYPLQRASEVPEALQRMVAALGAPPGTDTGGLTSAIAAVLEVRTQIASLAAQSTPSFDAIAAVLDASKRAFDAIRHLGDAGGPFVQLADLGRDLADLLVGAWLAALHPIAHQIAVLLTLIELRSDQAFAPAQAQGDQLIRLPYRIDRFHLDRLVPLLRDPAAVLRAEYGNALLTAADADAMADRLFPRVLGLLRELGVPCRYGIQPGDEPLLGDSAPLMAHALVVYLDHPLHGLDAEAGAVFSISSADRGDLGLVVSPFGLLTTTRQAGRFAIELKLTAGVDALAYGRHGLTLLASAAATDVSGSVIATLPKPDGTPAFVFGSSTGSRVELGGTRLAIETSLSEARQTLALSAAVSSAAIVLVPGDGDGFLRRVLPADGLRADFDLGLAWSNERGLSIQGAAGLDATLPVGLSLGGVLQVPTIHLGLHASDAGLEVEVSASVALSIGPVQAVVDRLGILAVVTFPSDGGNLGPIDVAFGFKPPSGIGLLINSAGVTGGGFLSRDAAKHEYAGVLQLEFSQITLQAFGLLTTQVAGGDGYSLLALVDARFPPVRLGWGFTLDGVGGLLALHRTASVDALHAALRAQQLSTLLFPTNAITDAPKVIAELDAIFPTAPGRFLFGPMAKIGWGTPTVLTATLAIIVELPEPIRIILLARLEARLPSPSAPLVRINMDALGVLDFDKRELSLDATLFDSRLVGFALSGAMALRATWGAQREFVLAVGGVHPAFTPPPGFPALQRIAINMPSGIVSKLRLSAYLAITSNTVQLGADLDVAISVSGFGLAGHLGFDALLQLVPFHFDADISGSVTITAWGNDLASVALDASLSGPAPWSIAGHFKISAVFFDVHVPFSHSWGDEAPAQAIAPVDVRALLAATLADPRSWGAPLDVPASVSLRRIEDPTSVVAHPLARLEVHERVVPLGLDITRFGSATPQGARRFAITDFRIAGKIVARDAVQDDFAPAQFLELSDDEKLARPSFEPHDAGVKTRAIAATAGAATRKTTAYETFFIDDPGGAPRLDLVPPVRAGLAGLTASLALGAAGRMRRGNYVSPGRGIQVAAPRFSVVDAATLRPAGVGPSGGVYSDVEAALNSELARAPHRRGQLLIVGQHEIGAA